MKISDVPLMQPVLCKHLGTSSTDIFEIMKLGYSACGKAVYVRITFGMSGQDTHSHHYWRDVSDMDAKWDVIDSLNHNLAIAHMVKTP